MFRAIIVNENTKHFREVNILEQTFDVYFSKKTSSARLDLIVIFDNYDEMSDSVREYERLRLKANEYGSNSKHFQIWSDFCNTCADYKERLKNNSGVDLLQEYERYLFDSKNARKKYERIKDYK